MPDAEEAAKEALLSEVGRSDFQVLETFVRSLEAWAAVTNLVSAADRERLWSRHVADSVQVATVARSHAADCRRWIDLGSGAGFPGLVVAVLMPEIAMTLVESNRKKAAFLLRAAADCGVRVNVEGRRAEAIAPTADNALARDVVSARAVAPLHRLLGLAAPFFGPSTLGLFPKGREAHSEIEAVSDHTFDVDVVPSRTDPDGAILAVTNLVRR